jgi:hypothetical protein
MLFYSKYNNNMERFALALALVSVSVAEYEFLFGCLFVKTMRCQLV